MRNYLSGGVMWPCFILLVFVLWFAHLLVHLPVLFGNLLVEQPIQFPLLLREEASALASLSSPPLRAMFNLISRTLLPLCTAQVSFHFLCELPKLFCLDSVWVLLFWFSPSQAYMKAASSLPFTWKSLTHFLDIDSGNHGWLSSTLKPRDGRNPKELKRKSQK